MLNTPSPTSTATIHGLADRVAAYRALDLLLFEVIGSWITDSTSANLRPYFAAWSQHHAWHAELWAGRYPVIPDLDVHAATQAAGERFGVMRDAVPTDDVDRVRFLTEQVLPQLEAVLADHRAEVVVEVDAPTGRVLDLVLDDVRRDAAMARQLLPTAGPTGDPTDSATVDLAAAFAAR